MLSKRILILVFVFVVAFLFAGCFPTTTPPNEAPIITSSPITTATVGVLYTYDVNATDPNGDTLTYSLAAKPAGMTIKSATGIISWTPTLAQVGNNSVTVKVSDGTLSVIQNFTIKVGTLPAVNQAPVINSTQIITAKVGVLYTYDVEATDPNGDTLTYSLTTYPSGMAINPANGLIWWVPTLTQVGNNSVTAKVSDGVLSDTQSFIIKVSEPSVVPPTNQAPIIISTQITAATVGVAYVYEVKAFDPDGDVLTYSLNTYPSGMVIDGISGTITWTPVTAGNSEVTVEASDGGGLSDTQTFTITVSELPVINQAPVIYSTPVTTATVGVTYFYDVEATDPNADTLTYSLMNTYPSGMAINPANGLIWWVPTLTQVGNNSVTAKVSDGVLSDTQTFTIEVTVPKPPVHNINQDKYYDTIKDALDDARDFETIEVAAGTYEPDATLTIDKRSLTLRSIDGPNSTIIDSGTSGRVFHISANDVVIGGSGNGFTIKGKGALADGLIYVGSNSTTIEGNYIVGDYYLMVTAAGVSDLMVKDNTFLAFSGTTEEVSGIYVNPDLISSTFQGNTFPLGDGSTTQHVDSGIYIEGAESIDIISNTFEGMGLHGGVAAIELGAVEDINIEYNTITNGRDAIWFEGTSLNGIGDISINHNDIYDNVWAITFMLGTLEAGDVVEIHQNNIDGNNGSQGGLDNQCPATDVVNATNNWWGDADGPYHPTDNLGTTGDEVSDNVVYIPWSTLEN